LTRWTLTIARGLEPAVVSAATPSDCRRRRRRSASWGPRTR